MAEVIEKVTVQFGADGTRFETGTKGLERKAKSAGERIEKSFKSERMVANQARGFVESLGQARNATDVLVSAGQHLGESFKASSLLMGVGIASAVAVGVEAWGEYKEQVQKAKEAELDLMRIHIGGTEGAVESGIDKYSELARGLRDQLHKQSSFSRFAGDFGASVQNSFLLSGGVNPSVLSGRDRQINTEAKAEGDLLKLEKEHTRQMREQVGIAQIEATGDKGLAALARTRIEAEEKIADVRARGASLLDSIKDPRRRETEKGHTEEQVKAQEQLNAAEIKGAERAYGIQVSQLALQVEAISKTGDATEAELRGRKDIAAQIKLRLDYEKQVADLNEQVGESAEEYNSELTGINKNFREQSELISRTQSDLESNSQQQADSATADAESARAKLHYNLLGAEQARIKSELDAKNLAISQKYNETEAVRDQEYRAAADAAAAAYGVADRNEHSRLITLGAQVKQGQAQVEVLRQVNEGNKTGSERTKIWADYQAKVDANAADTSISYQQQQAVLKNLTAEAEEQDRAWQRQTVATKAQLDLETKLSNLRGITHRDQMTAIADEEAAIKARMAVEGGEDLQRDKAALQELYKTQARAEIAGRRMTGQERAAQTREDHAVERQMRADERKRNGKTTQDNLTSDWASVFHKPARGVHPVTKPSAPVVPHNMGSDIGAAVAAAITNFFKDKTLLVAKK